MLKKLNGYLQIESLVTLYKSFKRPHLDYADVIYDNANNINICDRNLQSNAVLAISGAIRWSSEEKLPRTGL